MSWKYHLPLERTVGWHEDDGTYRDLRVTRTESDSSSEENPPWNDAFSFCRTTPSKCVYYEYVSCYQTFLKRARKGPNYIWPLTQKYWGQKRVIWQPWFGPRLLIKIEIREFQFPKSEFAQTLTVATWKFMQKSAKFEFLILNFFPNTQFILVLIFFLILNFFS